MLLVLMILDAIKQVGGIYVVTVDHGNAEDMVKRNKSGEPLFDKNDNLQILTSHTCQPATSQQRVLLLLQQTSFVESNINKENMSQGGSKGDGNSKANKFIKEFSEFTKQIELLMVEYEKLVETKATQLQEIDRLKALVADKDETIRLHEQRCSELREEADALRMSLKQTKTEHDTKVAKHEKKLKSKGKEVGKSSNEIEGTTNSMLNSMNMIKEKLKGLELEGTKTASLPQPKEQLQLIDKQETYEHRSCTPSRERRSTNSISREKSYGDLRSEFLENGGKTRWPGAPKLSSISPHTSRDHPKSRTKPYEKSDDDLGNELLKNGGKTLSPRPPGGEPKPTSRRSKKH